MYGRKEMSKKSLCIIKMIKIRFYHSGASLQNVLNSLVRCVIWIFRTKAKESLKIDNLLKNKKIEILIKKKQNEVNKNSTIITKAYCETSLLYTYKNFTFAVSIAPSILFIVTHEFIG